MVTKLNKPNCTKSTNRNSNNKISSRIPKNNRKMKIEEGKNEESKIRKVLNTVKNKRGDLVGLKRIKMTKKMKILSQYQTRSTTPVMTIVSWLIRNGCATTLEGHTLARAHGAHPVVCISPRRVVVVVCMGG